MQLRSRTIILLIITVVVLLLSLDFAWPWISAGYIWQESTIDTLESSLSRSFDRIPKILHQTYRDNHSIPWQWQQASNSCRTLHSNYQYRFWNDIDARHLIENELPDLLPTFDSYPYDIQRADVIRLVVLYVYGGIYLDLDIICLQSLDQLLKYDFIVPRTSPVGLSNDVIISKARHPFLLQLLENLPRANRNYLTKSILFFERFSFVNNLYFLDIQQSCSQLVQCISLDKHRNTLIDNLLMFSLLHSTANIHSILLWHFFGISKV